MEQDIENESQDIPLKSHKRFRAHLPYVGLIILLCLGVGYSMYRSQQQEKRLNQQLSALSQKVEEVSNTPGVKPTVDPNKVYDLKLKADELFLGSSDAPVAMVEYGDFQCPFCKKYLDSVFPAIKSQYIDTGKVKFYFRHYPFLGQESNDSAEASICAKDQNKFWEYHDILYKNQGRENSGTFAIPNLKKFAVKVGLNSKQFNTCLDKHQHQEELTQLTTDAVSLGVKVTPSTFVNGKLLSGVQTVSVFSSKIEQELKKK